MGFQTNGKLDFGIAACTVENPTKLWKAPRAEQGKIQANLCLIRTSTCKDQRMAKPEKTLEQWKTFVF
jgi:hypothetical protein